MIEKLDDRRNLVFSYLYLVRRMEKWKDEKLICLVEKKNERIINKIGINLQLYPNYIRNFYKNTFWKI